MVAVCPVQTATPPRHGGCSGRTPVSQRSLATPLSTALFRKMKISTPNSARSVSAGRKALKKDSCQYIGRVDS